MVAQKLYESGKITYMRTDSPNLSELAINTIRSLVTEKYGVGFLTKLASVNRPGGFENF